ncbi:hypothetical protein FPRO05_10940 [Fusarium proliferatum]|uniref:Uncharacterized protein n=1 Tax=Gibberella intermedia TaxID=948311 RepID=A0A365NB58_GIBIN|nr:hypothetical protein FPRO05_10940 [Fusarium proliferatum]
MITDNQTYAEVRSVSPVTRDWPHYATSVVPEEFPTCQEQVDEICSKTSKDVVLYYTTIDAESVPESAPVTMETIQYQREWAKDVQLWFKNRHYEPVQHSILDSAPLGNCHQGLERHQWLFNLTFSERYHCYKCDKAHEFSSWGPCLGKEHKLNLGDQEQMDAFYEMQLRSLAQLDRSDSLGFWLTSNGPMKRPEFWSTLCELLWNRIEDFWEGRVDKLERKMLTQLLRVARHEELFVSQGKGDGVIYVSCGNLDWYRSLRSKVCDGDERPRLSVTEMGLFV